MLVTFIEVKIELSMLTATWREWSLICTQVVQWLLLYIFYQLSSLWDFFILCGEWRSEVKKEQKSQNFTQNSLHIILGQDP